MSSKYPGGIISKTAPVPSGNYANSTAPGVWTLEQQAYWQKLGQWPIPGNFPNYIEDVFSTYLYTGNGTAQTITNGIDLSTKGGLVWIKDRTTAQSNNLFDTARGPYRYLESNGTNASLFDGQRLSAFTSSGFSVESRGAVNLSGSNFASWTFRKQPKFFDVVTWTGNGTGDREISHNLGSAPGCIILKCTSTGGTNWLVYHRALSTPDFRYIYLNDTSAALTSGSNLWNVTSTTFRASSTLDANNNGATYVAYLFAHDAGGFGLTGTDNVISCGSYTCPSSGGVTVNLGYEPEWILTKKVSGAENWNTWDTMRAWSLTSQAFLAPNLSNAENPYSGADYFYPTSTGFRLNSSFGLIGDYIYIAIRRGPMKVPTSGTSVFQIDNGTNNSNNGVVPTNFPVDTSIFSVLDSGSVGYFNDRLRGYGQTNSAGVTPLLTSPSTSAESSFSGSNPVFYNATNSSITRGSNGVNAGGVVGYFYKRAPSFFDEVCYTGTGSTLVLNHNLTVVPELIIGKRRTGGSYWILGGNFGASTYWYKNAWGANDSSTSASYSGNLSFGAQPTSTTVTLDSNTALNISAYDGVLWMWATCPGVSKVGTYTGTGALQTINCGFTTGARFVLIARVGVVGNNEAYVWDSARGIIPASDPYLLLNSTDAQVTGTDYIDTTSVGFDVTATASGTVNVSGGSYIFLAIA